MPCRQQTNSKSYKICVDMCAPLTFLKSATLNKNLSKRRWRKWACPAQEG